MFHALAIAVLAAVPAQGGQLKLANLRITIGELGPNRANAKFLPGDILFFGFDVNGLSIEANGDAKYKMETRVLDSGGKQLFKTSSEDRYQLTPLRGNSIPIRAYLLLGLDMEAGNYTVEATVEDPKTKAKDTVSTKFEVTKRDFGIVNVYTSYDEGGTLPAPNSGIVGQTVFVQFTAASFERDPKTKQPKLEFQYQFLDEKGTPILTEPRKRIQDSGVDEKFGLFSIQFPLFMNRPGKFTVKITATDKVANKTSTFELPVTIHAQN